MTAGRRGFGINMLHGIGHHASGTHASTIPPKTDALRIISLPGAPVLLILKAIQCLSLRRRDRGGFRSFLVSKRRDNAFRTPMPSKSSALVTS